MACPYFYPVSRLEEAWAVPPRLPLGDAYSGECRAGTSPMQPQDTVMRGCCNSGYARGSCDVFPNDSRADAVRFTVASDLKHEIRVQYIFENACWPLEHGELLYSAADDSFAPLPLDEIAARQAAVFMQSYLRRTR